MTKELEKALRHIKTRADLWAVREVEKALSQEPCESIHGSTYGGVSWGGTYKSQEPTVTSTDEPMTMVYPTIVCDDAVSREAVIKDFTQWRSELAYAVGEDYSGVSVLDKAIRVIKGMPSVTQMSGKCKTCKYGECYNDAWCRCTHPQISGVRVNITRGCEVEQMYGIKEPYKAGKESEE